MKKPFHRLRALWRRAPLLTAAMVLAFVVAIVFALRFALSVAQWQTLPQDPGLQGWMTPRYVAHARRVPPRVVQQALDLDPDGRAPRVTLEQIAAQHDVPLTDLLSELRLAIEAHRLGTLR